MGRSEESPISGAEERGKDGSTQLLQSVALYKTEEFNSHRYRLQFDCSYRRDKRDFILGKGPRPDTPDESDSEWPAPVSSETCFCGHVRSAKTDMDFDQLETFLEVAKHASFSRAAEKRFRTQPAISSQIRGVEEEVGAKLFDRSGGKVSLTAAGKAFLKYVEDTLDARKAMMVSIAEMERVPRGEIIVGANEGTCLHILPYVFADFKKQYPDVSVNIKRSDYAKILESIIDNSVDFGVISLPVTDSRLTVVPIHRDELILIAPPQHPIGRMRSATISEASKFPLIVPKAGHTRDAIEQLFHERRLKPNFTMELDSSELLKRFVAADVGIGFIARSNVEEDVRAKVLAAVPMADAQVRRDLALVFRKDKALSRAALAFIDIAVKHKSTQEMVPTPTR